MVSSPCERLLIVGGGPIGMIESLLLARQGIPVTIIEKRLDPPASPQAHVLKQRSMEILRDLGIDREVLERGTPAEEMRYISWVDRLQGPELARLDIWAFPDILAAIAESGTAMPGNLAQNIFERILLTHVEREPLIELRLDCEVTGITQTADQVTVTVLDRSRGGVAPEELEAPYLVACDGASSRVREWLGIGLEGPEKLATVAMIHFEADLSRYMADRPGVLFWNLDPENPGNFIVHDMRHTHVYMHPFNDNVETHDAFTPARAAEIVRRAIGDDSVPFEIVSVRPWIMRSQVATAYRSGRVFLAGDAAHRFPPTGGLGMNTGIGEAFNLSWKLAACLWGWGGEALLDSYEAECRPLAKANADHSLNNSIKMLDVAVAIGLIGDPVADRAVLDTFAVPGGVDAEKRRRIDEAVRGQIEHFLTVGLDLGGRYVSTLVQDGGPTQPESTVLDFVPTTRPGSRLPHVWLDLERSKSSHDVIAVEAFTLLTRAFDPTLRKLVEEAADKAGVPLVLVEIGEDFSKIPDTRGFDALLVRPDKHVGWRGHLSAGKGTEWLSFLLRKMAGVGGEATQEKKIS